jgi:hypothetical protein
MIRSGRMHARDVTALRQGYDSFISPDGQQFVRASPARAAVAALRL